ncbi:MAG: hypothetical protein K6E16_11050, partial [Lachnospiraceae bacterium]|nr:hypothetical protein [Lachnospiraceae bacterium]
MKKQVILSCIMILALCAGCGSSGDVSGAAAESGSVTESATDVAVTEEETSEEAVTEDTVSIAAEAESTPKYNVFIDDYNSFDVTSTSLNNGVWNDVISNTDKGSNKSPQL